MTIIIPDEDLAKATPAELAKYYRYLKAELAKEDDRYFPGARPAQQPPEGDWSTWVILAGRGFGKTRTGAEWIVELALRERRAYGIAAPTFEDARDICVEGESGVLAVLERRGYRDGTTWNRTLGELMLPNGSSLKLRSAEQVERFRGRNFAASWCDELAAWRYADAFTQLRLATRVGNQDGRMMVTTTPRPTKLIRGLLDRPTTVTTVGSTFDNAANLSPAALAELRSLYEGTRIGRQELYAELLVDTPGALWTQDLIDGHRVEAAPSMRRIVVAIDPAVTSGEDSDDTGIVAAGLGTDGHVYVLADRTLRASPDRWARAAVDLYDELEGDRIVAEVNNGGDLVELVLRTVDSSVPVRKVHASRGKRVRAEPVAALYEQGRVHHVGGLAELEDQLCTWTPDSGDSPDRLDALVWAVTDLAIDQRKSRRRSIVNVAA